MIEVAIFVCVGWLLSVCLHEFGHAIVAYWGGDTSVKDKGYLTLNPVKYTDINLSLVLPLIFLLIGGIPLPGAAVYIDQRRLRNRWWKSAVSAAGPLATILVALLLAIAFKFNFSTSLDLENRLSAINGNWIWPAIAFLVYLEVFVVIINLLPIPSLDGYGIIEPWLPPEIQTKLRKFAQYGIFVLFALVWFVEPFGSFLSNLAFDITETLGIPLSMIGLGYNLFNKWASILLVGAILVAIVVRKLMQKPHDASYERGMGKLRARKFEDAIADFDRAIRHKSDFAEAWYMRGYTLTQLQRYEEALDAYNQAIEIQPDDANIWTNRGVALGYLKQYEEAIASCDRAIKIEPENFFAWLNKGGCYAEREKIDLAIESLKQAAKIDAVKFKEFAKNDSSLDSIRNQPAFKQLIGE